MTSIIGTRKFPPKTYEFYYNASLVVRAFSLNDSDNAVILLLKSQGKSIKLVRRLPGKEEILTVFQVSRQLWR